MIAPADQSAASPLGGGGLDPSVLSGLESVARLAGSVFQSRWAQVVRFLPEGVTPLASAGTNGIPSGVDEFFLAPCRSAGPDAIVWTEDAAADPRFRHHAAVQGPHGIHFFASAPVLDSAGELWGTVWVGDLASRMLGYEDANSLRELAGLAAGQLKPPPSSTPPPSTPPPSEPPAEPPAEPPPLPDPETFVAEALAAAATPTPEPPPVTPPAGAAGRPAVPGTSPVPLPPLPRLVPAALGEAPRTTVLPSPAALAAPIAALLAQNSPPAETTRPSSGTAPVALPARRLDPPNAPAAEAAPASPAAPEPPTPAAAKAVVAPATPTPPVERLPKPAASDTSIGGAVSASRREILPLLLEFGSEILGLIGPDGKVRLVTGALFALLAYHPDELVGRDIFDLIHKEDHAAARHALSQIVSRAGGKADMSVRLHHAQGNWVQVDVTGQNLLHLPGVQGVFIRARDAGERLAIAARLTESELRFRQLFDDNPQPMYIFDYDTLKFLAVNEAALRQYGYSREEFMQLSLLDMRPAEDLALFQQHISRKIETPLRRTWRHRKRTGEIITVEVSATSIAFDGHKARLVAIQDITERMSAVESLKRRNRYMTAQVEMQLELLKPRAREQSISALLASLGKAAGASRTYYYSNTVDPRTGAVHAIPVSEWCSPGIFSELEVFGRERIPFDAYNPEWLRKLRAGEPLALEVDTIGEPERSLFSSGGVRSALLAPLLVRDEFVGFLGLDDCVAPRRWDRSEADLVQAAAAALVLALEAESVSQSLDEEKDRFAVTLASIADGVITTDSTGCVVFANRVAETLLGRTQEELVGCELSGFFYIGTATGGFRGDPLARVLQSGEVVIQPSGAFATHKSGARIPVAKSTAPIRNRDGKIIGAVRVFRDTTPEQRMASEMMKASKLESIGILAGGIAHDFNNILTAVVGNVSLAKMFLDQPARAAAKLDEAERASFRAKDLTSQLLTFSKGGAPVKKLAKLDDIIRESVDFALHGSKVVVRFNLPADLPPVEVDAGQLSQVINNLAINAVQAMPDGGALDVWAQARELEEGHPTGLPPGYYVKICVEDTGKGIPPENQSKIFDPFFTTKDHGSGLGLATSYSIIKNHGGVINFDSIPGQGTIFRVYLPASAEHLPTTQPDAGPYQLHRGSGRILVMDDEADIRQLASVMLEQLGYEVTAVADGQMALDAYERARAAGTPYDAYILDLTVPGGLGGMEVLATLKAADPFVRAIVSSGYANASIMADYAHHGFADILSKPYRVEEISAVLDRVLGPAPPADSEALSPSDQA